MKTWLKRSVKSKTMNWGHFQLTLGAVGTALAFVTPQFLPNLPVWAYTIAAMVAGVITYVLREKTRVPLDEK